MFSFLTGKKAETSKKSDFELVDEDEESGTHFNPFRMSIFVLLLTF
jgi:hypothetical protein